MTDNLDECLLALLPSSEEEVLDAEAMGEFMDNLLLDEQPQLSNNHPHIRKRQKDELEYLRVHVTELTNHLELLKALRTV
ncbi:hypothetical protein THRCLA_21941 [Thraustotheca clavata]|uniref:Uncharacterized protein n=1 Tax=Thraustotheca clavata TaxID=74557 RepID=A0A1V9ZHD3_9STRA|nr:hypothetical protein THRCLA_21941 [Thraustotheca clavata]